MGGSAACRCLAIGASRPRCAGESGHRACGEAVQEARFRRPVSERAEAHQPHRRSHAGARNHGDAESVGVAGINPSPPFRRLRHWLGGTPTVFLNARLNAASDS